MEISFTKIEPGLVVNAESYELVVSGLTMRELHQLVEENYQRRHLAAGMFSDVYLCYLVAKSAIAKNLKISYEDACSSYQVNSLIDSSMNLISTIVYNLKLNKRTQMVVNTAINQWGRNGTLLMSFSDTETWRKYVRSLMKDLDIEENIQLAVRKKMVQEAFEHNPDQVFPEMKYVIYRRH